MKGRVQRINLIKIVFTLITFWTCIGCFSSKKINGDYLYFSNGADTIRLSQTEITIQPNDLLYIVVSSKTLNQQQAAIFNMPNTTNVLQGYKVSSKGDIDMPVIGEIKAAGFTRTELQNKIEQSLIDNVKNPVVMVRFLQFNVNVLGEVHIPGVKTFSSDKVTIIDALSVAGDLTDYGKRDEITIIREEGGKKIFYNIDLRSRTIFDSPVYQLQPNDVVYVAPNKLKLKKLDVDPEAQRKTGILFSVISTVLSLGTLALYFFK